MALADGPVTIWVIRLAVYDVTGDPAIVTISGYDALRAARCSLGTRIVSRSHSAAGRNIASSTSESTTISNVLAANRLSADAFYLIRGWKWWLSTAANQKGRVVGSPTYAACTGFCGSTCRCTADLARAMAEDPTLVKLFYRWIVPLAIVARVSSSLARHAIMGTTVPAPGDGSLRPPLAARAAIRFVQATLRTAAAARRAVK
jgi:hypothetical protein